MFLVLNTLFFLLSQLCIHVVLFTILEIAEEREEEKKRLIKKIKRKGEIKRKESKIEKEKLREGGKMKRREKQEKP